MKLIIKGLAAVATAALSTAALAQATIVGSPHDLSNGVQELCVYCHTPHGGTQTAGPLWNRNAATTGFTMYDSTTLDADNTGQPGPVSLACLSCHDGAQSRDTIINAPGRANVTAFTGGKTGTIQSAGLTNSFALIGTDLQDDHPIGIAYCGGGRTAGTASNAGCADTDFKAPALATNGMVFFESTTGAASADKADVRLYGANDQVECASCHDPHNFLPTGGVGGGSNLFLRTSNARSAVCLACHNK